jgi:hypothetical protein
LSPFSVVSPQQMMLSLSIGVGFPPLGVFSVPDAQNLKIFVYRTSGGGAIQEPRYRRKAFK